MAFTKIAAAGIGSTETVTLHSLEVLNNATVGGVLTYEDVTNVDSVGLITARAGIVVGSGITLSKDGDIFATGVTTSTSFVGDGSQLTGVASTENIRTNTNATFLQNINVSGTSTVGGAIFADADLFMVDSLRHTGDTDTKIRFPSADTITFETAGSEGARIDSSGRMILGGSASFADVNSDDFQIEGDANTGMIIKSGTSHYGSIYFGDGTSGDSRNRGIVRYNHTNDSMELWANTSERLRIDSSGRLLVATDTATGAAKLQLLQSTGDALLVRNHDTNYEGIILSNASGEARIMATSGGSTARPALTFFAGDTERLRIDSSGRILVAGGNSYHADADDLVLKERSGGNVGMTLQNTTNGFGVIYFGDAASTTVGRIQYDHGNDSLDFYTGNSERMSITGAAVNFGANQTFSSNNTYYVGTNTAKPARNYSVKFVHREGNGGSVESGGQNAEVIMFDGNGITMMHDAVTLTTQATFSSMTCSRGGQLLRMRNNGGGAIYSESGSISSASDYRIKENVVGITSAISIVKTLNPVSYNIKKSWNPEDDGVREHGFIAHELAESIPNIKNIASGVKDATNEDGSIDAQGVDYSRMTPILTAAIKELIAEVETLKAEVAALKGS